MMYEDQLQQQCIMWWHNSSRLSSLRKRLHCNNNNSHNRVAGNRAKAMGVQPGVADLEFMMRGGKTCYIELKRPGGVQSRDQKEFEALCQVLGHEYHVIFTFEEFKRLIGERI
jgi:hypothetical protein